MRPSSVVGYFLNHAAFDVAAVDLSVGPARSTTVNAVCRPERRPTRTYEAMF